jgi:hypothetical protein
MPFTITPAAISKLMGFRKLDYHLSEVRNFIRRLGHGRQDAGALIGCQAQELDPQPLAKHVEESLSPLFAIGLVARVPAAAMLEEESEEVVIR